jgi:hypothetical protein
MDPVEEVELILAVDMADMFKQHFLAAVARL